MVRSEIVDACSIAGFADPPGFIKFELSVSRTPAGRFDVTVSLHQIHIPPQSPPLCQPALNNCDLMVEADVYAKPIANIVEAPAGGMVLGEVRPLRAIAEDVDRLSGECGTTPGHDPASSHFGEQPYCDRLEYQWSVAAGEGEGEFLVHGRSTLFRATKAGEVTLFVFVIAEDGEFAYDETTFVIHEPRVRELSFGGPLLSVYRDLDATEYQPPHWLDQNGDGQATTVDVDRRFPIAYERGSTVEVAQVLVACGTQPVQAAVLRGKAPDRHEYLGSLCSGGGTDPEQLEFCGLEASIPLPNHVEKYVEVEGSQRDGPYAIGWELSFGDDYFVPVGTTDNSLYVTLGTATLDPSFRPFESLYDIGCKAAAGQSDLEGVVSAIWSRFKLNPDNLSDGVHRKARDGWNVLDGIQLGYYAHKNPNDAQFDLSDFLAKDNGNGRCQAWVQLLTACWQIHGAMDVKAAGLTAPSGYFGIAVQTWVKGEPVICVGDNGVLNSLPDTEKDTVHIQHGNGEPNQLAIHPGPNGVLETQPVPDDRAIQQSIVTGLDGVCQTPRNPTSDDLQVTPVGQGRPHRSDRHIVAVRPGPDLTLDTTADDLDHEMMLPDNGLIWHDVYEQQGVPGQKNHDPISFFNNHVIVEYSSKFYDPSYGRSGSSSGSAEYLSISNWEDDMLFAIIRTGPSPLGLDLLDMQQRGVQELVVEYLDW